MNKLRIIIKRIIVLILSKTKHDSIVFESIPDLSDNAKAVFDEMIRRGLNNKYKMVWLCMHKGSCPEVYNTTYVSQTDLHGLKAFWSVAKAKCIISCNNFYPSNGNYQKSVYVMHGVGLKKAGKYTAPRGIDYITCLSDSVNKVIANEIHVPLSVMKVTGFPRNDDLLNSSSGKIRNLFDNKYSKIIVWYPTFRQHVGGAKYSDSSITFPIIHNPEDAVKINKVAKDNNVLIVLKPHFSQDVSMIEDGGFSNIKLINDNYFLSHNVSSYEFVGGCDALITDYSSIFFDFLLCNKPVASVWEDIEEYKKNRGFAFDVDYYMKGAFKIYTVLDFVSFVKQIASGKDTLSNERKEILNIVHYYKDSNSSRRVVDFIEENVL